MTDGEGHGHNHPQCERCWIAEHGTFTAMTGAGVAEVRRPVLIRDPDLEVCCWCGRYTIVGIFVRSTSPSLLCRREET